jgi:thiopeptide-type bacteriocin biosynthesis protein
MTSTTTAALPSGDAAAETWLSLHCHVHWAPQDLDEFLSGPLNDLLADQQAAGGLTDWFFIRYWEGGPHVRLRLRGVSQPAAVTRAVAELVDAARYEPALVNEADYHEFLGGTAARSTEQWQPHGTVRAVPYVPETQRYGGEQALPVAEDVFCRSSEVALALLPNATTPSRRLAIAGDLALITSLALGLDELAAASWLRGHVGAWRWSTETKLIPTGQVQAEAEAILRTQAGPLRDRGERIRRLLDKADADHPYARWVATIRQAREDLEGLAAGPFLTRVVWTSQLHMIFNRLGVLPDEERVVCWLIAQSLLRPDGVVPYYLDGADAPDRELAQQSKYLRDGNTEPYKDIPYTGTRHPGPLGPDVDLPVGPGIASELASALTGRVTTRGALTGPLAAGELGDLLRWSHGYTHETTHRAPGEADVAIPHRPYPSPGARYPARLRIAVYDVPGVPPGLYHVDGDGLKLQRLAEVPDRDDVRALSVYLQPESRFFIDIQAAPIVVALYIDLRELRAIYGLRALRFAQLEAGQLAQTLFLVASSMGIATATVGAFIDDMMADLFVLDGVQELPLYLIPMGRSKAPAPRPR